MTDVRRARARQGTTVRSPGSRVRGDIHVHAVQLPDERGVSIASVGPGGQHPSAVQQDQIAAEACRHIEIVGRDDDRQAAALVEPQRASIGSPADRRGPATRLARRAAARPCGSGACFVDRRKAAEPFRLCQRAGNDHSLLLAAGERVERARFEVERAGRRSAPARELEIVRSFDLERPRVRIAAHDRHFQHRVVEGQLRFLRHHGHPRRQVAAPQRARCRCRREARGRPAAVRKPASSRSSVVLPDPFGPRMPTMPPAGNGGGDVVQAPGATSRSRTSARSSRQS